MRRAPPDDPTVLRRNTLAIAGGTLEIVSTGAKLVVGAERKIVGRSAECALVAPHRTVSKVHVEVEGTELGLRVADLRTSNGTFVGGHRIVEAYLTRAEELRLGDEVLRFTPGEPESVPLSDETQFGPIVGTTREMRILFDMLRRLAPTDIPILVTGESGVGKELVARAIHQSSKQSAGPFEAINCAAVAESVLESELFGHERGAFTGADRAREGLFRRASGGTVFLDEVGDMSLDMQAKLLRVLQEGEVRPVGSDQVKKVDVRLLSATCKNLGEAVNAERFRSDLLHRLGIAVEVPPLRKRAADIPFIVQSVLEDLPGPAMRPLSPSDYAKLKARDWPGNVRELRRVIEAAVALAKDGALAIDEALTLVPSRPAPSAARRSVAYDEAEASALAEFKRQYYFPLWSECRGNISEISRRSGRSRAQVRSDLEQAGIRDVGEKDAAK